MLKKIQLGLKFFLTLTMISIVPLAIISFIYYNYSKSRIEQQTVGNLLAINASRAAHINSMIQIRQEQAKELAGTFISRQLREDGTNHPEVVKTIQEQIDSIYEELKLPPRSNYKDIDKESSVEIISVWDIYGNIIASTNRGLVGKKEPFTFMHILYDQGAYFGGFEKDPLTGENLLTILEGVRNWDTDEYAGVILLKAKAKALNDITTVREGLGETAETYLVDKEFRMITESRFIKDSILNVRVTTPGSQGCFNGKDSPAIYKDYQGRTVLGVHKYLPDQEWCLLTEMDINEAIKPVIVFRRQMIIVVSILIILVLSLVHFAGRKFIRPIVELRNASLKVAKGNYNTSVTMETHDELGELSRAFNQMTTILAQTTSQLEEKNKILEQQKEELKKFDQLKSEFVSTVSHELRTPMTIIKESILQLLEEVDEDPKKDPNEEIRMLLTMALNNVNRLANMINNLLDLSKIEAGKIELHKEQINIVDLARQVCFDFKGQALKKNLDIRFRASRKNIEIELDKDKIIQVFVNLIGNSMKFVDKGYIEISVIEEPGKVVCGIADTGPGLSKEDLKKVFNKFQQFGRKDGPGVKGTGLGLSICKGLVDMHGGTIWVESELGKGTKFFFTLLKTEVGPNTEKNGVQNGEKNSYRG